MLVSIASEVLSAVLRSRLIDNIRAPNRKVTTNITMYKLQRRRVLSLSGVPAYLIGLIAFL